MTATRRQTRSVFARQAITAAALAACLLTGGCKSAATEDPSQSATTVKPPLAAFCKDHGLAGHVTLIEFGSVGCEVSEQGLDKMVLAQSKRIDGLAFARVELNKDSKAADAYYAGRKLPFPVIRDAAGASAQLADATTVPTFVLLDKFCRVRYRGSYPEKNLTEWAEALAAEKADPGPDAPVFGTGKLDIAKLLAATKLPDLQAGGNLAMKEYLSGNGLVLVFADTTCPFAVTAIGEMPRVAGVLEKAKITTVVVNIENSAEDTAKFYQGHYTSTKVLFDTTTATRLAWGVQSVPTVIYITPSGEVGYNGKAVWSDLGAAIEQSLKLKPQTIQFKPAGTGYG